MLAFLVNFAILLQVAVLLWVGRVSLPGPNERRLITLIWAALLLTCVVSVLYILIFLHLPRLSPGLLLFVLSLLGAGFQLAALATRSLDTRQIRLGAWVVLVCFVVFYLLNTLS